MYIYVYVYIYIYIYIVWNEGFVYKYIFMYEGRVCLFVCLFGRKEGSTDGRAGKEEKGREGREERKGVRGDYGRCLVGGNEGICGRKGYIMEGRNVWNVWKVKE
jgi:hypothetical protein